MGKWLTRKRDPRLKSKRCLWAVILRRRQQQEGRVKFLKKSRQVSELVRKRALNRRRRLFCFASVDQIRLPLPFLLFNDDTASQIIEKVSRLPCLFNELCVYNLVGWWRCGNAWAKRHFFLAVKVLHTFNRFLKGHRQSGRLYHVLPSITLGSRRPTHWSNTTIEVKNLKKDGGRRIHLVVDYQTTIVPRSHNAERDFSWILILT